MFGGVERETGKCFLEPVEDRTATTLMELIKKWIKPKKHHNIRLLEGLQYHKVNLASTTSYVQNLGLQYLTFKKPM